MYKESVVVRNLRVLERLRQGPASLEELAEAGGYRSTQVARSVRALSDQGLVEEDNGAYRAKVHDDVIAAALDMVHPWLHSAQESFYEIARDVAAIILRKSWKEVQVDGVFLYGSTLHSSKPRDIDMVIFHSGERLAEFITPRYAEEGTKLLYDVPAGHPENRRITSFDLLTLLGYSKDDYPKELAVRFIGERIARLDAGSLSEETIQKEMNRPWRRCSEQEVAAYADMYGIDNVFDVHVLHTGLFGDTRFLDRRFASTDDDETTKQSVRNYYLKQYATKRQEAIQSCRDPTFWHRVLSTGKLYNSEEHDFTLSIEQKYPDALKLFSVPEKTE